MVSRFVRICAIGFALTLAVNCSTRAEENHKPGILREMINHAEDLNLTADQKAKLNEIADGPMPKTRADFLKMREKAQAVLSKEQTEKMEALFKLRNRNNGGGGDDNDDHK